MAAQSRHAGQEADVADEHAEEQDDYPWKYESNPVPWWLALIWLAYFVWGIAYLVLYLI